VAIKALGLELSDREIEEIFTEADLDGDGYLTVSELEYILNKTKEEIFD
jgi:Ca2+-binding EF-hand superfamily protein